MTPEIITLTITSGLLLLACTFLIARTTGGNQMASTITRLREENQGLRERVSVLEVERSHDRNLIDRLMGENHELRCEIDLLKRKLQDLDKLIEINRHDADDARAEAQRAKARP